MKKFKKTGAMMMAAAIAFGAVGAMDLAKPITAEASPSMNSFNNTTEASGWNQLKTELWFQVDLGGVSVLPGDGKAYWYLKKSSDQTTVQMGSKQLENYATDYFGTNRLGNSWVYINTQGLAPGEYETHWTYVMNGAVHRDVVKFNLASNGYFNFAGYGN